MSSNKSNEHEGQGSSPARNRHAGKKGDPCEFISPPNLLLAKVTRNPDLQKIVNLSKSSFKVEKAQLKKMDALIASSEGKCVKAMNQKISQIAPIYRDLKDGGKPPASALIDRIQDIYNAAKLLDHTPVMRISKSLLTYLHGLKTETSYSVGILTAHLDALFNRNALDLKLDAPTKQVLSALETLVTHATSSQKG
ncbi:MAG: hypothetical protein RLN89_00570 [Parvibaculum sp.]